jgi:hypothetical protein
MVFVPGARAGGFALAVAAATSLIVSGCATTAARRVTIPPAESDRSPSVVVRVMPFQPSSDPNAPTGIELSKPRSAAGRHDTRLFSKVDIGTHLQISFRAVNGDNPSDAGGVRRLAFTIQQGNSVLLQGSAEEERDQHGMAPNSLDFRYGNIKPKRPIRIIVGSTPITVSATATNFHGTSNTLTVTYWPIDHTGPKPTLRVRRMP